MGGVRYTKAKAPYVGKGDDGGGGKSFQYEIQTADISTPNQFTLNFVPQADGEVSMLIEAGLELFNGIDFTVSGQAVNVTSSPPLAAGEKVLFKYFIK